MEKLINLSRNITIYDKEGYGPYNVLCLLVGAITPQQRGKDRHTVMLHVVGLGKIEVLGEVDEWIDIIRNGAPIPPSMVKKAKNKEVIKGLIGLQALPL